MADTTTPLNSHAELLDKIYRLQRHFYDLTRRYYLFGRDHLIKSMLIGEPKEILEVGCGTGRNLKVAKKLLKNSPCNLYGLDASKAMLEQAEKNLATCKPPIGLAFGFAESFSGENLFGKDTFDRIFFSYSLSMIPDWKGALENGLKHLSPNGSVWIVDFWDQSGYPNWFSKFLKWWLSLFHVRHEPALLEYIKKLAENGYDVSWQTVGRKYAYIVSIKRSS